MFKQGKGANIHGAVKIYAIANLLQGDIAILMQYEGLRLEVSVGFIFVYILPLVLLITLESCRTFVRKVSPLCTKGKMSMDI